MNRALLRESGENAALQGAAAMQRATVVDLTPRLAMSAATLSLRHSLPMADRSILATAKGRSATLRGRRISTSTASPESVALRSSGRDGTRTSADAFEPNRALPRAPVVLSPAIRFASALRPCPQSASLGRWRSGSERCGCHRQTTYTQMMG